MTTHEQPRAAALVQSAEPVDRPPSDRWAGWTIPEGYVPNTVAICRGRGCGAEILWCTTPNNRPSPHDRDGISHFATCPDAPRFRR